MNQKVFITSAGKFLPGEPITNSEIEDYLGLINGKPSRTKEKMLTQNGIQTRYYALNKNREANYSVSKMAALAIEDCLSKSTSSSKEIELISAATTQGDLPVPGFASIVHAETDIDICETASFHGVCVSGISALKNAYLQIANKDKSNAIVCASEFASRMFKA